VLEVHFHQHPVNVVLICQYSEVGMPSTTKQKIMHAPFVPFLSLRGSLTKNEGQLQQNRQLDPTVDARNVWRTAVSDADCGRRSKNE
jgi:hypothetical protein